MDLQLQDKRALVTGSSSGIGAGIARMLAAEGCVVVVHGRNQRRIAGVVDDIVKAGGRAIAAAGDVSTDAGADAVAETIAGQIGGVDILVNNAGGALGTANTPWMEVDAATWLGVFQTNVMAAVRMIHRLAPGMTARGWGRIIQISSAVAIQPIPFAPSYGAAKAAMVNLSVSLSKALGPDGVTVNTICPGVILTPAVEEMIKGMIERFGWHGLSRAEIEKKVMTEALPSSVTRIGRPEDIGLAVCMLASPLGGFANGANFRIDGGMVQSVN